jgi:hypothetical protein
MLLAARHLQGDYVGVNLPSRDWDWDLGSTSKMIVWVSMSQVAKPLVIPFVKSRAESPYRASLSVVGVWQFLSPLIVIVDPPCKTRPF